MVIDFHTHVYPPGFAQRREDIRRADATFGLLFANPKARTAGAPELLRSMDRAGVDLSVVMGLGWTDRSIAREVNDYILDAAAAHPGRLVAFCSVNPAWGDDAVEEVRRCAANGARGVGEFHPDTQGFDIADRRVMAPLMDAARELGLPVVTHSSEPAGHDYPGKGETTPGKLWRFARGFPDNVIVCAHWGGGLPFYALMPEVRDALANVYFDSAATPFIYEPQVFRAVAETAGPGSALLGSDWPLLDQRRVMKQLAESGLTEAQQRQVSGQTARGILGI